MRPSFQWIPIKVICSSTFPYLAQSYSHFLWVTFDCTLSFSAHVFLLKANFFPQRLLLYLLSFGATQGLPFSSAQSFFWLVLTYALLRLFPFLIITNVPKLERFYCAASCFMASCLSSFPIPLLSEVYLPPLQITLLSYEGALCLTNAFPTSSLVRLRVKSRDSEGSSEESLHPLTRSCILLFPQERSFCSPFSHP